MSPVADCNLKEYLQRSEDSPEPSSALRIRQWFGCLATAVQYLHTNQIRHRDIKPANILVHGTNILLVDLELALDWKDLAQSTTTSYCGGTPIYAAPEVIERRECNSTSDIWSLGCVFLEMATVIKGKSITAMQQYFDSQTKSKLFYHNPKGIEDWISLLTNLSSMDNSPFLWISNMLNSDREIRSRGTAVIDQIHASHTGCEGSNPYFGDCCHLMDQRADAPISICLLCGVEVQVQKVCSPQPSLRPFTNCHRMLPALTLYAPTALIAARVTSTEILNQTPAYCLSILSSHTYIRRS